MARALWRLVIEAVSNATEVFDVEDELTLLAVQLQLEVRRSEPAKLPSSDGYGRVPLGIPSFLQVQL